MIIRRTSPHDNKQYAVEMDITADEILAVIRGRPIAAVCPHLTVAQQVFFETGVPPEQQNDQT